MISASNNKCNSAFRSEKNVLNFVANQILFTLKSLCIKYVYILIT